MQDQRSMLAIAWVKRKVSRQLHIIDNTDLSFSWCNKRLLLNQLFWCADQVSSFFSALLHSWQHAVLGSPSHMES